ncbi:MAG: TonB-dependent receptor plug domain-containing protein, partial [Thermoanaerobaculia bacterium]|nr:TonB-dependent receptor plug domain-containing protein [Thermoanaerobaculia bacterium]
MRTTHLAALSVAFVLATVGSVGLVRAQDDAPQEASESRAEKAGETFTEEVTVTARKREETLSDVPFSVAAPTEQVLRDRGATTLEDVSANVAGFNVQNLGPGQSQVAMRGVSAGQIVRDQPGVKEQVGVYL